MFSTTLAGAYLLVSRALYLGQLAEDISKKSNYAGLIFCILIFVFD